MPPVTNSIGIRPAEPTVPRAQLEAGSERVFITHPRMFSFSHRCLQSLRHPFLAMACLQVEADLAKVKRAWQTKAERLSDTLTEGTSSIRHEEARWTLIGQMLDRVLAEDEITTRRQAAIENGVLRRSLENWWCKVGGTTNRGVSESAYRQVHVALYAVVLQLNDSALQSVINKAIDADWNQDSEGTGEVPFGRWYISLLEIADNWVSRCDGEAYGNYLEALLKDVFPTPSRSLAVAQLEDEETQQRKREEWNRVVHSLEYTASTMLDPPLVVATRNVRGIVEYQKAQ